MIVWLTKYALSEGMLQIDGDYTEDGEYFKGSGVKNGYRYFCSKSEIHLTKELAGADFERRRLKKIASHQRHISKLEKQKPKFIE